MSKRKHTSEFRPDNRPHQPSRHNPKTERIVKNVADIVDSADETAESSTDLVVNDLVERTMSVVANESSDMPPTTARHLGDILRDLLQNIITHPRNATLKTLLIAFSLMALARYGNLTDLDLAQLEDGEDEQKIAEARDVLSKIGSPVYKFIDTFAKSELVNGASSTPTVDSLIAELDPTSEMLQLPFREEEDIKTKDVEGSTLFKFAGGIKGLNERSGVKITKLRLLLGDFEGNTNDVHLVITDPNSTPQKGYAYLRATDAVNAAWLQIAVGAVGSGLGVQFDYVYDSANSQYVPAGDNLLILPPVIG